MKCNKSWIGYAFIIIITVLLLGTIYTYYYNDDVEKEYFANYLMLDAELKN